MQDFHLVHLYMNVDLVKLQTSVEWKESGRLLSCVTLTIYEISFVLSLFFYKMRWLEIILIFSISATHLTLKEKD